MTFFEASGQPTAFVLLLAAGFFTGLVYDLLAPLRRGRLARFVSDALWCLIAAAACLTALAARGENQVRLYALLGLVCGGGIYCLGLRRALKWASRLCRRIFGRRAAPEEKEKRSVGRTP